MPTSPLFVTTFGHGPPWVLALHGVSAHGLRFVRFAAEIAAFGVIAPDLRGHGRSPTAGPWTVAQHVADLRPLLVEAGPRPIVMGHSFGGLLAWELARALPHLVGGMVLVDPAIGVTAELADEGRTAALASPTWGSIDAALAASLAGRTPNGAWAAALDVAVGLVPDEGGLLRQLAVPGAVAQAWDEMRADLQASAYRGPTLLIEAAPEQGRYASPALVEALAGQLGANLRHVRIDVAHTIPTDAPAQLARLVDDFAAGLTSGA